MNRKATTDLFVVYKTIRNGKAERKSVKLWNFMMVMKLQAADVHRGLQHFCFPVVDGDLQVA